MTKLTARLVDGTFVNEQQYPSIEHMPVERVVELVVESEQPGVPPVTILVDPAKGDRVHRFSRVVMPFGGEPFRVEVYEVRREGRPVCRLYWHPEKGPILTPLDLYF